MIAYQLIIETYHFSLFKNKWVVKQMYPSTLIFNSDLEAWDYTPEYIDALKRRKVKLKEGRYNTRVAELKLINKY